MTRIRTIRTTAFRLRAEHMGRAFLYRPGARFRRAWMQLESDWRQKGATSDQQWLPYGGLAVALRVLSGDFVALQRRVEGEPVFMISRRRIDRDDLAMATAAWEAYALKTLGEPITAVLDDLACEEVDIAAHIHRRPGRCPTISDNTGWVWDVAMWEVAHRLAASPLATDDGPVTLRLDSGANLLTWDHLVRSETRDGAAAMHKVAPKLITVPGVEEPVISLESSLVRVAPAWRFTGGPRHAWAELSADAPLLRAQVRARRDASGFTTLWADRAAEVLRGASIDPLPTTENEPTLDGTLRTGYTRQPRSHPIGRGVGAWFHECVAHHARAALGPDADCLTLQALPRRSWPSRRTAGARSALALASEGSPRRLNLIVAYASSEVRRRLRDALSYVLLDGAHSDDVADLRSFAAAVEQLRDGEALIRGSLAVHFVKPPDAERWLLQPNSADGIEEWLDSWWPHDACAAPATAAIVETDEGARKGSDDRADPKHVLRAALAQRGVVSQFITARSAPNASARRGEGGDDAFGEHAAAHAVSDVLRSAGIFLRPFPELGAGRGTLVLGIFAARVTHRTTGRGTGFVANVIAASLGTHDAWGYIDKKGWAPIAEATAWFLGSDQTLSDTDARQRIERAVGQLPIAFAYRPAILLFDAVGCRRFWTCLTDKSEERIEPWMRADGAAVVRVRAGGSEVPRPGGRGGWTAGMTPATYTDFRPMSVAGAQGRAPIFVTSGSAVMSQGKIARRSTRFATSARGLREDWHALGATELLVLERGRWEAEALAGQVAMLCRVPPTWDRTLRWPSPLHLARAVVRDHPHQYFADGDDSDDAEK